MTNQFLEDQAKARGITVSEMMSERSKRVKSENRGLAANKESAKRVAKMGAEARWKNHRKNKLGSEAQG